MTGDPVSATQKIPKHWPFRNVYYGWAIVWASTLAAFGMAPMFGPVLGVFFTSIEEELGWSRWMVSAAFTIGSATGSIFQMLTGRLLDRYGSRMVIVVAGITIALAMVVLSQMQEPWQFWLAFGLGRGSALAGIQVGTGVALSNWFIRKRGRTIAIRGVGQRVGQSIMPLAVFAIMAVAGWRGAFLSLAGVSAVLIVLPGFLYLRRRPEDLGLTLENMSKEELDALGKDGNGRTFGRFSRQIQDVSFTLNEAKRTRAFWLLLLFVVVERFALGSINLHMVANFEDKGLSLGLAALTLSVFATVAALTGLPWGFVFEHLHVRFGGMLMSGLMLIACMVLLFADNIWLAMTFAVIFGLATGAGNIIENLLWADYFGRENLGAIRAFGAPFRLFSPTGPLLTGIFFDVTGSYMWPFSIFAVIFGLMMVAMFFATPPVKSNF